MLQLGLPGPPHGQGSFLSELHQPCCLNRLIQPRLAGGARGVANTAATPCRPTGQPQLALQPVSIGYAPLATACCCKTREALKP